MIADPYKILELTPNASDEEIKKAYRALSRKYHPDSYVNNPLADLAEEKFKEVQGAYDQIMKEREGGYSSYGSGSQGANYGNNYSKEPSSPEMKAVYNNITARRFREALTGLASISNRTPTWYYYSAISNIGIGNNVVALQHANQAAMMEPNNQEYVGLVNQLQWRGQQYQRNSYGQGGNNSSCGTGNMCCDLWCADSLCECMGGDLCSCM